MTVKEYLSQAYRLDRRIDSKLEQLSALRDTTTKATAVMSDTPVSHTRNVHSLQDTISALANSSHAAVISSIKQNSFLEDFSFNRGETLPSLEFAFCSYQNVNRTSPFLHCFIGFYSFFMPVRSGVVNHNVEVIVAVCVWCAISV